MNLCKKINDKYFCVAKNRHHQQRCEPGKMDQFDNYCQYMNEFTLACNIGDLIEMDQKTLNEEARI